MNLSPINSHLTERRVAMLAGAVEQLEAGVAAGVVPNKVFVDAKDMINRAIEEAAEAFLGTGPRHAQHPSQSDWWLAAYGSDAFVRGAHGVPAALKRAQKVDALKDYAAFIAGALSPLAGLLDAAKPLIKKRGELPKVVTPAQAAKLAKTMTCQCCARPIFAETGVIAHHGYERPGHGFQTASCIGARELPFEVSRDALGRLIRYLEKRETEAVTALSAVANGLAPVVLFLTDYTAEYNRRGQRPTITVEVMRKTFADVAAQNEKNFSMNGVGDYDAVLKRDIRARSQQLEALREDIKAQKARFAGWKQTHSWDDASKTWKAI